MNTQTERILQLFDAVADTYDQVGVEFFGPIAEGLVAVLDPRQGERALDLGCGRGAVLLPLARAVGPQGSVTGGDLSPRMVQQCRAVAEAEGLDHVEVAVVDAQEPTGLDGEGSGGFDVIASSLVLFFLPDPPRALQRWRDLLRPGGRVGVSTFADEDPAWSSVDDVFRPHLPPEMLDPRTTGRAGPFASDEGVEGLFRDAGLVDVRTAHRTVDVRFEDADHWYRFSMSVGQRAFWQAVPQASRGEVRAEAARRIETHADHDGSVTFHQDIRYTLGRRP